MPSVAWRAALASRSYRSSESSRERRWGRRTPGSICPDGRRRRSRRTAACRRTRRARAFVGAELFGPNAREPRLGTDERSVRVLKARPAEPWFVAAAGAVANVFFGQRRDPRRVVQLRRDVPRPALPVVVIGGPAGLAIVVVGRHVGVPLAIVRAGVLEELTIVHVGDRLDGVAGRYLDVLEAQVRAVERAEELRRRVRPTGDVRGLVRAANEVGLAEQRRRVARIAEQFRDRRVREWIYRHADGVRAMRGGIPARQQRHAGRRADRPWAVRPVEVRALAPRRSRLGVSMASSPLTPR